MQLNFLQQDLLDALQDGKPSTQSPTPQKPSKQAAADLFGGLPLAAPPVKEAKPLPQSQAAAAIAKVEEKAPDAMKTISEAAALLGVQQHVLRFWESRFSQIKPLKLSGGRRYYRPEDIEILSKIQNLLYKQGYTIKGAIRAFAQEKAEKPAKPARKKTAAGEIILTEKQRKQVAAIREELLVLRGVLKPYLEPAH